MYRAAPYILYCISTSSRPVTSPRFPWLAVTPPAPTDSWSCSRFWSPVIIPARQDPSDHLRIASICVILSLFLSLLSPLYLYLSLLYFRLFASCLSVPVSPFCLLLALSLLLIISLRASIFTQPSRSRKHWPLLSISPTARAVFIAELATLPTRLFPYRTRTEHADSRAQRVVKHIKLAYLVPAEETVDSAVLWHQQSYSSDTISLSLSLFLRPISFHPRRPDLLSLHSFTVKITPASKPSCPQASPSRGPLVPLPPSAWRWAFLLNA